jgi:potassium-transporting ATPase KdpC subunit
MRRQLVPAVLSMIVFTLVLGVGYSLIVTGVAQLAFKDKSEGSLVQRDGKDIGSSLIGQAFVDKKGEPIKKYFQSRPSAALGANGKTEAGYDPTLSSGSNLGPTNPVLLNEVAKRVVEYRKLNGLSDDTKIPVDAVTASASGLDPDISVANARLQASRVARERDVPVSRVRKLVDEHTSGRTLGVLGEKTVNVLELNLALDRLA